MIYFIRAVTAALQTSGYMRSDRWRELLDIDARVPAATRSCPPSAIRWAVRVVRLVSLLRIPGYRNTCLYRSVAVCILLRSCGEPVRLRLGASSDGVVKAHAWVETNSGAVRFGESRGWIAFQPATS